MHYDNTRAIVDLDAIAANIDAVRAKTGKKVMAIIKADAYGHGAVPVARVLEDKCSFFGVSCMAEAMELRMAGIQLPILILGYTPVNAFPDAIRYGIRPAIFHYDDALALSDQAQALGLAAPFHFAVDTGMSRIGFQVTGEEADICARIAALPGLVPEGMFSHFATADCTDLTRTHAQAQRFAAFDEMLKARGVQIPLRHLDNSAGIMNFPHDYEMVRSGIITYGLYPSDEVDPRLLPIRPAMRWESIISHIKTLEPGREISYGGTYVTSAPTRVATIPVGYADGYKRSLSGRFYVLIHGKKAPILGRICMDQMMVDVSAIADAQIGDTVVLVGCDGDETISMELIGNTAGSFNYEFPCGITRRVPRIYLHDGQIVDSHRYLFDPRSDSTER